MRLFLFCLLISLRSAAQNVSVDLTKGWQFSKAGSDKWYQAKIPGTVHTDLLRNKLISDPFFSDNEKQLQWIDSSDWIYKTSFNCDPVMSLHDRVYLNLEGIDTYADVYLNNKLVVRVDNMFRGWEISVSEFLVSKDNELKIYFHSAQKMVDSIAKSRLPIDLPDNNRVYARKAQFQFGWDWGPKFIGCGIWKNIKLEVVPPVLPARAPSVKPVAQLVQLKDAGGESFYFEKDSKPVYAKGANWIPANIFLPEVSKEEYRKLLVRAKNANMNMLRVWGGGIYEDDYFYQLCDSLGIMVWQDFMFAGGMYPADDPFLNNVKAEVKYQIERLRVHPCIVLWCGNNEIDEAWHNWGWQKQFNLHGADSAKVWNDYKILFEDSLRTWVNEFDGKRPYVSSSPKYGWGNAKSLTDGDSHYWGLWWGLEPWEAFETHTGRFVSEYGMQSMPNYSTVKTYVPSGEMDFNSVAVQSHQKASDGFKKLQFYLDKYFIDSNKLQDLSLEKYVYLTQCLQYYILKNSIAVHRSKEPHNMGTLLWQLNDCWPVTSWSITDFARAPKAAWYAVKEAYRDDVTPPRENPYPKNLLLKKPTFEIKVYSVHSYSIKADTEAKYIFIDAGTNASEISDNYFDLKAGEIKIFSFPDRYATPKFIAKMKITSLYDVLKER